VFLPISCNPPKGIILRASGVELFLVMGILSDFVSGKEKFAADSFFGRFLRFGFSEFIYFHYCCLFDFAFLRKGLNFFSY
jgi:hypothetical protein